MALTTGEAIKLLTKAGFTEMNQVGSHRKFGKGEHRFTVVYHRSPKETMCRTSEKKLHNLLNKLKGENNNQQ